MLHIPSHPTAQRPLHDPLQSFEQVDTHALWQFKLSSSLSHAEKNSGKTRIGSTPKPVLLKNSLLLIILLFIYRSNDIYGGCVTLHTLHND